MADETHSISIQVGDSVDTGIEGKIIKIADASDRAASSVASLKAQLANFGSGGNGLAGLVRALNNATVGTSELSQATSQLAQAQAEGASAAADAASALAESTEQQVAASETLTEVSELQAVAYRQLADATIAAQVAKKNLSAVTRAAVKSGADELVSNEAVAMAMAANAEAAEQLTLAKQNIAETIAYETEMNAGANVVNAESAATQDAMSAATNRGVSETIAATAATGILEGRTLSLNRAFAQFITRVVGLGPILRAAFPVIGAIAMLSVLYQVGHAFESMITKAVNAASISAKAFDEMNDHLRASIIELEVGNDKLDAQIAKLEHKPTSNGAQLAIDQAREAVVKYGEVIDRVDKQLNELLKKGTVGLWGSMFTGQATTADTDKFIKAQFDAIMQAKSDASKAMESASALKDPKAANKARADALNSEISANEQAQHKLESKWNDLDKLQKKHLEPVRMVGTSSAGTAIYAAQEADHTAELTRVGEAGNAAKYEVQMLRDDAAKIGKESTVDTLRDQLSGVKAEAKAAEEQWKGLEAAYHTAELAMLNGSEHRKMTAHESLNWWSGQSVMSENKDKLAQKQVEFGDKVAEGNAWAARSAQSLSDEVKRLDLYGEQLKVQKEIDAFKRESAEHDHVPTPGEIALHIANWQAIEKGLPIQEMRNKLLKDSRQEEEEYSIALRAAQQVMKDHPKLTAAMTREINRLNLAHKEATDPLYSFTEQMNRARATLGQYGDQLRVTIAVQQLAEELKKKGYSDYQQQAESQRSAIEQLQREEDLQRNLAQLYDQTAGAMQKLRKEREAIAMAPDTWMSQDKKQLMILNKDVDQSNLELSTGKDRQGNTLGSKQTMKDMGISVLGQYAQEYQKMGGTVGSVNSMLKTSFKTLGDGVADSIGRAVAYGKDLGKELKEVGRNIAADLISSLVKLAEQLLIVTLLMKALHIPKLPQIGPTPKEATQGIASMGMMTAAYMMMAKLMEGPLWSVATALSIISFGAAGYAGAAGVGSAMAVEHDSSLDNYQISGYASGGLVTGAGTSVSDSILARLSNNEYVMTAGPTSQHKDALDLMRAGASSAQLADHFATDAAVHGSVPATRGNMSVQIHNYSNANIKAEQVDENTVRIIARQEANQAVRKSVDASTANAMSNPNSKTAKAMRQYYDTSRRRNA